MKVISSIITVSALIFSTSIGEASEPVLDNSYYEKLDKVKFISHCYIKVKNNKFYYFVEGEMGYLIERTPEEFYGAAQVWFDLKPFVIDYGSFINAASHREYIIAFHNNPFKIHSDKITLDLFPKLASVPCKVSPPEKQNDGIIESGNKKSGPNSR